MASNGRPRRPRPTTAPRVRPVGNRAAEEVPEHVIDSEQLQFEHPLIGLLAHIGRFSMIESVARQLNISLDEAQPILEAAIDPDEPISYLSMMNHVKKAVDSATGA